MRREGHILALLTCISLFGWTFATGMYVLAEKYFFFWVIGLNLDKLKSNMQALVSNEFTVNIKSET